MVLHSDKAKLVLRRVVTFEYELLDEHYVDSTSALEILNREKETPFSTWARQTDFQIMQDRFLVLWNRDKT